jgi:hypothetical protein
MQQPTQQRRRVVRAGLAVGTAVGLAVSTLATMSPASAAVPKFPNNVVVFPNRDFVSIEGYADHAGETATVSVKRAGAVVGSASAVVSGTDVAFEINHPGGVCWGAGTGLNVTPDIVAGDVVSIAFPGQPPDDTTVSTATVSRDMTKTGTTVTVEGTVGTDVVKAQMEQRIVNPDLVPVIGKRDVRAVPGPLVPAPKGGYSSALEFPTATTFLATYVFDTQEGADTAAAADLGERAMSWQEEDADGNRQGLTIAEFGEVGGPGFGGCPQGPANQAAPVGSFSVIRAAGSTTAQVKWTPATAQPGAEPVSGYEVSAVGPTNAAGIQAITGLRLGAGATTANLTGLDGATTYTFEVRSMAGEKLSVPFSPAGPVDTVAPTLSLSPAGDGTTVVPTNAVTVASNGQVFVTTDGTPVISGDLPSDTATLLTGTSIPITARTELSVAAFDQAGNFKVASGVYAPVTGDLPAAPAGLTAGAQTENSVPLTWTASPASESVTGYQVTVYDAAGTKLATQPSVTTVPTQTVTGLQPGTTYQFSVAAKNAAGTGPDSARITKATSAATDRVTITSAKWKATDFRIVGTGSVVGATVQAFRVNANGTIGAAITGATAQVVAAAPPGIGDYDIRLRANVPATNPGRVFVKSNGGGIAGPFTVANG